MGRDKLDEIVEQGLKSQQKLSDLRDEKERQVGEHSQSDMCVKPLVGEITGMREEDGGIQHVTVSFTDEGEQYEESFLLDWPDGPSELTEDNPVARLAMTTGETSRLDESLLKEIPLLRTGDSYELHLPKPSLAGQVKHKLFRYLLRTNFYTHESDELKLRDSVSATGAGIASMLFFGLSIFFSQDLIGLTSGLVSLLCLFWFLTTAVFVAYRDVIANALLGTVALSIPFIVYSLLTAPDFAANKNALSMLMLMKLLFHTLGTMLLSAGGIASGIEAYTRWDKMPDSSYYLTRFKYYLQRKLGIEFVNSE